MNPLTLLQSSLIKRGSRDYEEDEEDLVHQGYICGLGMTPYYIAHIAQKIKVHMYMIDLDDTAIWHWPPTDNIRNTNLTPICFKKMNGHFYPHGDPRAMNRLISTNSVENKHKKKNIQIEKSPTQPVIESIETDDPWKSFFDVVRKNCTMPPLKCIEFVDGQTLRSFKLDGILYVLSKTGDQHRDR